MIEKPLVSVLMPNYNCEKYVKLAIESILKQTYENFELLILDDCSSDNSWEVILEYTKKDKRIKSFRNEKNLGIVRTRNKLFDFIDKKSKYFALMDSDDISHGRRLEAQVEFLEENGEFVGCGSFLEYFWDGKDRRLKRYYETDFEKLKQVSLIKSPFPQPTMMINIEVLKNVGKYNEKYEVCEDWDFWMRILQKYKMTNIEKVLYYYRQSESQSKSKKLKLTILNGIKIKLKYMKIGDYFNFKIMLRFICETFLLLLPKRTILWIFYRLEVSK